MKYVINGACLLKTGSVEAEETWTLSMFLDIRKMQWVRKILKCIATEVFFNGAEMVVEEDRSDREGII